MNFANSSYFIIFSKLQYKYCISEPPVSLYLTNQKLLVLCYHLPCLWFIFVSHAYSYSNYKTVLGYS